MLWTPSSRERRDGRVAVDPRGQLDDEDEPAPPLAARVRAGSSRPSIPAEGLAVEAGHPGPVGEHLLEALELGQAERAGDVAEAVVEAEPVVVEPAHVGRAALVALASRSAP